MKSMANTRTPTQRLENRGPGTALERAEARGKDARASADSAREAQGKAAQVAAKAQWGDKLGR
jgi:hypothetical protein